MKREDLLQLRETWRGRIAAFRASGQTGAQWCAAHQLKEHQLWYWVGRFRDTASERSSGPEFLPVQVEGSNPPEVPPLLVRVGAAAIEVRPGYDPQLLRHLVQTLTATC
jgi:transposase-like protein